MLFPHCWRNWESIHSCYQSKLRPERGCVLRITLFGALAQQFHQSGVKCLFVETVGSAFVQYICAARMCRIIVKPSNEAHEMLLERKIDLREGHWAGGKPLAVHTELESGFLLALYISPACRFHFLGMWTVQLQRRWNEVIQTRSLIAWKRQTRRNLFSNLL